MSIDKKRPKVSARYAATRLTRFLSKIDRRSEHECWIWKGSVNKAGYGKVTKAWGETLAHRVSWKIVNGAIPAGMFICHHCDNPPCVNPSHLFVGTHQDNMNDRESKGRNCMTLRPWIAARGEQSGTSKLTEAQVSHIKTRLLNDESISDLGREFGVHVETIGWISRGVTWRHVKPLIPVGRKASKKRPVGKPVLNEQQVRDIRRIFAQGNITKAAISKQFSISSVTVGHIVRRRTWDHI